MKTRSILISMAVLLPLASCDLAELGGPHDEGESSVTINVGPADAQTRSSVGSTDSELTAFENKIVDLTLFRYAVSGSSETLESATYYDLSSGSGTTRTITVSGKEGTTYKFYGLLNCGDKSSAVSVGSAPSALQNITVTGLDLSSMQTNGIPMVNRDGVPITFGTTVSAEIPMTRMVARWDFKIDRSDFTHGNFMISNIKLCQTSTRVAPFEESCYASSSSFVQDGDVISSADKASLANGGTITLYVPENACGDLLPSNINPWSKVPSGSGTSLSGKYPTYLEVTGDFIGNDGLTLRATYKMFLGKDNCKNFDVVRGYRYTLTLYLTEDTVKERNDGYNWKVEMTELWDNRNFQFVRDNYAVPYGKSSTFDVLNETSNMGIYYSLSSSISSVASVSADTKVVTNNSSSYKTGTLTAYYWDGTVADQCNIILGHSAYESPTILYIVSNNNSGSSSGFYHDPDCPKNHRYHDPNCSHNHTDHLAPDYEPYETCPNWIDYTNDCPNKVKKDYSFSMSSFSFSVRDIVSYTYAGSATMYSDYSDSYLAYESPDVYISSASFGPKSDPSSGFTVEADGQSGKGTEYIDTDNISAELFVNKLDDGTLGCGAQIQSGNFPAGYNTWSVNIAENRSSRHENYTFSVFHLDDMACQTYSAMPTVSLALDDDMLKYTVSCSSSDAVYMVSNSDYIQIINLTSSSHSNVFHDGDEMIIAVASGAPTFAGLVAMTDNGQKLNYWPINTSSFYALGPSINAWVDYSFCLYSGPVDCKAGLSVNSINGKVAVNPTVSSSQRVQLSSSNYSITNYSQYSYVTVNAYSGYYYFNLRMPSTITFGSKTLEGNLCYSNDNKVITLE